MASAAAPARSYSEEHQRDQYGACEDGRGKNPKLESHLTEWNSVS